MHVGSGLVVILTVASISGGRVVGIVSTKLTSAADVLETGGVYHEANGRDRRALPTEEQLELLDLHNALRRQEGSSNMELMSWNSHLEQLALDWARRCEWRHGQPYTSTEFEYVGQNLYATTGVYSSTEGVQLFYDEKIYYDYDTGECSKDPCGHYTQVVWASSRELGCAYFHCDTLHNSGLNGGTTYLVCNYGPGGNIVGRKPFKKGSSCSQCASGEGWCSNGLCTESCGSESSPSDCSCQARCNNCGTIVNSTCTCICRSGWTGPDCSEVCEDTHERCGANPGWPATWCDRSYVVDACPVLCNICNNTISDEKCVSAAEGNAPMLSLLFTVLCVLLLPNHYYSFSW